MSEDTKSGGLFKKLGQMFSKQRPMPKNAAELLESYRGGERDFAGLVPA